MSELLAARVKLLVSVTNCPACGAPIASGGGGIAFATSSFECGSTFSICQEEIAATTPCPRPSHVAAHHLNTLAAQQAHQQRNIDDGK
jgi:hypothetical protein